MEPSETDQINKKAISKPIIIFFGLILLVSYIGLNIWLFYSSGIVKKTANLFPLTNTSTATIPHSSNNSQANFQTATALGPTATPTPTPTPLQGPGRYACDPYGICKDYSDEMRKNCTTTFADRDCLGQCGNAAKRCTQ